MDMNNQAYFAHNSPQGTDPGARITAAGFSWASWGESIAGGSAYPQPADALAGLIADAGVADLGHRRQLLAIDAIYKAQNQVGIGIVQNGSGPLTNYYTIDTAQGMSDPPFLTGVVFADNAGTGKYTMGEGMGGVTITAAGVGSTSTWSTGGYSLAVHPGTYKVTASGGPLASPITTTVTVGTTNYRLNFSTGGGTYIQELYSSILGRQPTSNEVSYWLGIEQRVGRSGVAWDIEQSPEARTLSVANWYQAYLGRTPGSSEAQWWVDKMIGGTSEEAVISAILGSPEFYQHSTTLFTSGTNDQRFVSNLYSVILGRTPSANEISGWLSVLASARPAGVVQGFVGSTEFRSNVIKATYTNLLHRSAGSAEVQYWLSTGLTFEGIRVMVESSQEYVNLG
jgi:hypothetical protein